jgi:GDPmannose 4,6-dehydratase
MKTAIVTGVTGQDGYYLTQFLLEKNYQVIGVARRNSRYDFDKLKSEINNENFSIEIADLNDLPSLIHIVKNNPVEEIYNLAAQSHVGISFTNPISTTEINATGTLNLLECIRLINKDIKFYQASSSELFGETTEKFQNEDSPFQPRSPYGCAKLFAFAITKNYREAYGMFASNGILFNHESPRRSINFVTRKVTSSFAKIKYNKLDCLQIGNLDSKRDWGYAKDFVEMMWKMLQHDKPDDFVIATGEVHSVREMIEVVSKYFDFDLEWKGEGVDEIGVDKKTNKVLVRVNPDHFRPSEVSYLRGSFSKAEQTLNWKPTTSFEQLMHLMCKSDAKKFK